MLALLAELDAWAPEEGIDQATAESYLWRMREREVRSLLQPGRARAGPAAHREAFPDPRDDRESGRRTTDGAGLAGAVGCTRAMRDSRAWSLAGRAGSARAAFAGAPTACRPLGVLADFTARTVGLKRGADLGAETGDVRRACCLNIGEELLAIGLNGWEQRGTSDRSVATAVSVAALSPPCAAVVTFGRRQGSRHGRP